MNFHRLQPLLYLNLQVIFMFESVQQPGDSLHINLKARLARASGVSVGSLLPLLCHKDGIWVFPNQGEYTWCMYLRVDCMPVEAGKS
jgi:hypothetical protein